MFLPIDLGSSQASIVNITEHSHLWLQPIYPFTPLTMITDAGKRSADAERDAVWESETPFAGRGQDLTTSKRGSSRSHDSPALTSDSWRRPTPEIPRGPSPAANNASPDNDNNNVARPPRITSRLNPTRQQAHSVQSPRQQRPPLTYAATARTHMHSSHQKPLSSYMKQSCLPVDERDPVLELAEQHKGRKLAKELYKPGMIIRAPLHEPALPGVADNNDRTTTECLYGPIFTKVRKMIVVALYHNHYTALPIYTHNGKGLEGKLVPDEYVSVKDHRSQEPFAQLSKHSALVTQTMNPDINMMHPKATVHLTYPVSRKYDLPTIPEGQLQKASTETLIALYSATIPKSKKV